MDNPDISVVSVKLPRALHKEVRLEALERDIQVQDWYAEAARQKLDRDRVKRKSERVGV